MPREMMESKYQIPWALPEAYLKRKHLILSCINNISLILATLYISYNFKRNCKKKAILSHVYNFHLNNSILSFFDHQGTKIR